MTAKEMIEKARFYNPGSKYSNPGNIYQFTEAKLRDFLSQLLKEIDTQIKCNIDKLFDEGDKP